MLLGVSVGDLSGEDRLCGQVGQFYMLLGQAVKTGRKVLHALRSFRWRPVRRGQAVRTGRTVLHALLECQVETSYERTGCEDR